MSRGGALFQRVPLQIKSRTDSKRVREMINNPITHLKEEASEDAEHKGWCDTELTKYTQTREEKTATVEKLHATVDELEVSMENLAMEVAELSAQVSRLQEEVSNATSIRHEETATNEEDIKDVQDAQLNLTQAIQILMDFYAKAGQAVSFSQQSLFSEVHSTWTQVYNGNQVGGTNVISFIQVIESDFARLESETTAAESEAACTFDEFTGKAVEVSRTLTSEICPTVVQVGANVTLEDCEDTLHQVVEKARQLFACLVSDETVRTRRRCVISVSKRIRTRLP